MAQILEYIKMALANIKANKGRSILTMLGIIIGISSVITIMAVGDGFEQEMNEQLSSFAGGQLYVYAAEDAQKNDEYMNSDDMDAIETEVGGVTGTSPQYSDSGTVLTPKGTFDCSVQGGGTAQQEISSLEMVSGRYYNSSDISTGNRVCVLKRKDAIKAFGTDDVLGMNMEISLYNITIDLTIIGIAENKNADSMVSFDYSGGAITLEMPYTTFENFGWETTNDIYGFYVTTDGTRDSKDVASDIVDLLNQRHHAQTENYYQLQDFNDQMGEINNMMGMITGFISFVAGISLLVGGIGVMNIMLVSVTERTREIGIRKSLGAKTGSIMMQFLAESAIIACIGGIIGIMLGLLMAYGICSLPMLGFPPGVKASTILLATLFSSGIGVFFGIYPARKAAKLSPIEALRRN